MDRRITLADSDAAGVAFYPRLMGIAHDAYEHALAAAGLDLAGLIRAGDWGLPVVAATINCSHPLRHGDPYSCRVVRTAIGTSSCTVMIVLLDADGREAARVEQTVCAVRLATMQAMPLPAELRGALERLPAA